MCSPCSMTKETGSLYELIICKAHVRRAAKIIAEMEGIDDNLENDKIILVKVILLTHSILQSPSVLGQRSGRPLWNWLPS